MYTVIMLGKIRVLGGGGAVLGVMVCVPTYTCNLPPLLDSQIPENVLSREIKKEIMKKRRRRRRKRRRKRLVCLFKLISLISNLSGTLSKVLDPDPVMSLD